MESTLPVWFQADRVFSHGGQWYFGARNSLHVGPYADQSTAESRSREAVDRLQSIKSEAERLRFVRKLLHEEWDQILLPESSEDDGAIEQVDIPPPAVQVRHGEPQKPWYRSNRFFKAGDVWFFSTREGIDVGPFPSDIDARKHERRLIRLLNSARSPEEACRIAYEYKHRPAPVEAVTTMPLRQFRRIY
jgi:hypothetical protein